MEVAGIDIDAKRVHIERNLPRGVRAVDDGQDASFPGTLADQLDGQGERGWRGDVAHENSFGALGNLRPERFDDLLVRGGRQGNVVADKAGAHLVQEPVPGHGAGAVFVVGGENFVTFLELEGADDEIDAPGGVRDVDDGIDRDS